LQTLSENKKINILNHVTENCFVIGDYNKLVEIFYNIVQNAIKYSNSNTQINITQFKNTDNVTIKVKDEGYGIPKTSIPRVTERFFRVDPEHSKKIGGTGLGLAIVKHLINQHRGEFHIESEIGKGSEFFVKLPLHN
jgi:two-component system phosphate regulon sensor histidine kinase PhoR